MGGIFLGVSPLAFVEAYYFLSSVSLASNSPVYFEVLVSVYALPFWLR